MRILKLISKRLIKIFLICLSISFIIILMKLWNLVTDGFRLDKIQTKQMFHKELFIDTSNQDDDINNILSQKFYYLDRGCQAYVFESADKKYVLKLLRYSKYNVPFWTDIIDIQKCKKTSKKYLSQKAEKAFWNTMTSYKRSYDDLKDQTAVCYVHLTKTDNLLTYLKIVDRLKREKIINPNKIGFVIQKKTQRLEDVMFQMSKSCDIKKGKEIIDSFFDLAVTINKKNIVNRDYNCVKNSGYLDSKVVGMDLGSYYAAEVDLLEKCNFSDEIRSSTKHLRKWLVKHWPELTYYYDEKIENIVSYYGI